MNSDEPNKRPDDYLDEAALKRHLKAYGARPVPGGSDEFFERSMRQAVLGGARRARRRVWLRGFGTAIAASLALFAVTLMLMKDPQTSIPSVTMELAEPQTVNLVFASATVLRDATLTVTLPEGVDLAGFEGEREVTWMTSLQPGKNVLPLSLVASSAQGGEVLATLVHEDDDRTFRLRVTVI